MIINIENNNKILKEKSNLFLPDFTVLTGENGSGKTQLLHNLSKQNHRYEEELYLDELEPEKNIRITDDDGKKLSNIIFSTPGLSEIQNYNQKPLIHTVRDEWNSLSSISKSYILIKNKKFESENNELDEINKAIEQFAKNIIVSKKYSTPTTKKVTLIQLQKLKEISLKANKPIFDLTFIDFIIFYKVSTKLFSSALAFLFHQFYLKQKYYKKLTKDISPPWEVFNDILKNAKFKYKVVYEPVENEEIPPRIKLEDNENGKISAILDSLSSGEKTIMSLIFVLYHSSNKGKFPEVILFDEPDAHLHPSLTNLFISVIKKVLIEEQKVKVILATHSPSTVALAPEESIYRMDRSLGFPIKESKNSAIQNLSNGLASVSIEDGNLNLIYNIEKTSKHILFTEGITDKIILEIAWEKLYKKRERPFVIQDSFSANFLGTMFEVGNDSPDGIFVQFPKKKMIALFDFDNAGYNNWNRKKKFPNVEETDPSKCLTRSNGRNAYLLLLPVSRKQPISNLAIMKNNETFKDKSKLTIESLFLNVTNYKNSFFQEQCMPGGGSVFLFKNKNKRKFAKELENLESIHFNEFIPLFDKIISITKSA